MWCIPGVQKYETNNADDQHRCREEATSMFGAFRARVAWASPTCTRGFLKWVVWLIPVWTLERRGTYRSDHTKQSYGTQASADPVHEL